MELKERLSYAIVGYPTNVLGRCFASSMHALGKPLACLVETTSPIKLRPSDERVWGARHVSPFQLAKEKPGELIRRSFSLELC